MWLSKWVQSHPQHREGVIGKTKNRTVKTILSAQPYDTVKKVETLYENKK